MEIHPHHGTPQTPDETIHEIATVYPNVRAENWLPIVALGGSAGSLAPLQTFFTTTKPDLEAAYVVITHLAPDHESALPQILQRTTDMPVIPVTQAMKVEPNHVYVIQPGTQLTIFNGVLEPTELLKPQGKHVTVDLFFRALADAHGPEAIAIVLSGGDGDGTMGFKRIKERGGLTVVQDPLEAEWDGMPRAAIASGMVDWVLTAGEMAGKLLDYKANARKIHLPADAPFEGGEASAREAEEESALVDILTLLQSKTGHDFSSYKRATVLRRLGRRMQVNGAETLSEYFHILTSLPAEVGALLQDLLISVTNFFRDKEAFTALSHLIPELFRNKSATDSVRVWVPGCATGEEAYSIAMMLMEHASTLESPPQIQIFATDLDQVALDAAREGRYAETIVADLTEERLRRFFTFGGGAFTVTKTLRDKVFFAVHDLLRDPPFPQLDLVSCRNLLIYLNREAQRKVSGIFHFGLRPNGKVFLGTSESIDESLHQFRAIDRPFKLYTRLDGPMSRKTAPSPPAALTAPVLSFDPPVLIESPSSAPGGLTPGHWGDLLLKFVERIAAPSILIHRSEEIVYLSQSAGRFLQNRGGKYTANIFDSIHPMLGGELRAAWYRSNSEQAVIRTNAVALSLEGRKTKVEMLVQAADDLAPGYVLLMLVECGSSRNLSLSGDVDVVENFDALQQLGEELDRVKSQWRQAVGQYETSNQELKVSNEELQAMNEELRSATEELETGREELQSINEEIISVNQELKSKVAELSRANSDLQNLMASTNIATIFIDRNLRIKRFTPSSTGLFNFIPSDIGRPFSDLTHRLDYPEIAEDSELVIRNLSRLEREVRDSDGRWFLARMFPYRSETDQIAGVVITCVDITERKRNEEARKWLSAIVESSNDAIISFTLDGLVVSWNKGAEWVFGYSADEIVGKSQSILAPEEYQSEKLEMIEKLRNGEAVEQIETVRLRKDGQRIDVSLSASVLRDEAGEIVGATAIAQDVTLRKQAVEALKQTRDELEERVQTRTAELQSRATQLSKLAAELTSTEQRERKRMAQVLHDHLQQILVAAKIQIDSLAKKRRSTSNEELASLAGLLQEALASCRALVFDLSPPVLAESLGRSLQWLCGVWMKQKYSLEVTATVDTELDIEREEVKIYIFQAVRELLFNVVKHANVREASVDLLISENDTLVVTVRDEGVGFDPNAPSRRESGFGLFSLRERLEMIGGSLELKTRINGGVTAIITAPIHKTSSHEQPTS